MNLTRQRSGCEALLSSDRYLLAEVVRAGVQALMEAEPGVHVNAGPFERGEDRRAVRNGCKPRQQRTRVGTLELLVPQTRDGFYPSVLERYQRSEAALITALAECYVQGARTRKVASICQELFGDTLSHETVSRYTQKLDEELEHLVGLPRWAGEARAGRCAAGGGRCPCGARGSPQEAPVGGAVAAVPAALPHERA